MTTSFTSPVAVLREGIVMPADRLVTDHNWILGCTAAAVAPTAHLGRAYVDAEQAAPPRGVLR